MGLVHIFSDYMSQFYDLWFAVLIHQVIKDPIHKLQRLINFFHCVTLLISGALTFGLSQFNTFGVQVNYKEISNILI
jgi:hypothetical protein